jgi:hypothetical protein
MWEKIKNLITRTACKPFGGPKSAYYYLCNIRDNTFSVLTEFNLKLKFYFKSAGGVKNFFRVILFHIFFFEVFTITLIIFYYSCCYVLGFMYMLFWHLQMQPYKLGYYLAATSYLFAFIKANMVISFIWCFISADNYSYYFRQDGFAETFCILMLAIFLNDNGIYLFCKENNVIIVYEYLFHILISIIILFSFIFYKYEWILGLFGCQGFKDTARRTVIFLILFLACNILTHNGLHNVMGGFKDNFFICLDLIKNKYIYLTIIDRYRLITVYYMLISMVSKNYYLGGVANMVLILLYYCFYT